MKTLLNKTMDFLKDESGPTATEYAVMLALIIVACITAVTALGSKVDTVFTNVEAGLPDGT